MEALAGSPAPDAARARARQLGARVRRAAPRLADPADGEALHDFRVALRRLRAFLRAYARWLPVDRKTRKALHRLARSTNGARDGEVMVQWLETQRAGLTEPQLTGVDALLARRRAAVAAEVDRERGALPLRWTDLERRLQRELRAPAPHPEAPESFADASAARLREACTDAETALHTAAASGDDADLHRARIRGKRLRYLLESFTTFVPAARTGVRNLKAMQDRLGELHDLSVLGRALAAEAQAIGAPHARRRVQQALAGRANDAGQPDELAGLVALAARVHRRARTLRAAVARHDLAGTPPWLEQARATARALAALPSAGQTALSDHDALRRTR